MEVLWVTMLCFFCVGCGMYGITKMYPDPPEWWEKEEKKCKVRAKTDDPGV
tara:strand:+ start:3642 stop:3794 length:153 start_codon:yes stop_codon:yes gene_type:complete